MGVSMVLSYSAFENKSSQQVLESLYKHMDTLGAKRCGVFKVDCETYTSISIPNRVLQLFHDSERSATTFAILDNGYQLVATSNFDTILNTYLNYHYPSKKGQKVECCGQKFELSEGDFVIRISAVSQDVVVRGIIIEIEYGPCVIPQDCWDILAQVACNFISPNHIPSAPLVDGIFKPADKMKQYQNIINSMRKSH